MTDYTKLVEALRCCSGTHTKPTKCPDYGEFCGCGGKCLDKHLTDAAAAIEELLPKRGEIVRCRECIHFTQGGWCDREFDWFPVDGNDFCSMAEKMEVQE